MWRGPAAPFWTVHTSVGDAAHLLQYGANELNAATRTAVKATPPPSALARCDTWMPSGCCKETNSRQELNFSETRPAESGLTSNQLERVQLQLQTAVKKSFTGTAGEVFQLSSQQF
ncbi:hypothetical protein GOODEAATRI_001198 [Goodea atripinnis]|uniref:Uncharacterized protein n=1 Tax=Goodea atripinnis TaxID=208336 RepID=A0ABV0MZ72_9TELE